MGNIRTREVEGGGLEVQGYPRLHSEFEATLGNITPCLHIYISVLPSRESQNEAKLLSKLFSYLLNIKLISAKKWVLVKLSHFWCSIIKDL